MKTSPNAGPSLTLTNRLLHVMRRHPLFFFFLLAFGLTWVYELPVFVLLHAPLLPWAVFLVGPTLSAFIMALITEGRPAVLRLLRRYVLWRVGVQWYLFVLLGMPALLLLSFLVLPGGMVVVRAPAPILALTYLANYIALLILGGPLWEEPGWRGFALPRLQQRSGPLVGSLLLGVLWGLWHLPLFLIPGYNAAGSGFAGIIIPFLAFVLFVMALTCIFTWVFNNTRGSLLLPMLLHASINQANSYASATLLAVLFRAICAVVVALLIIAATRGRLSYQRYQRETALPTPGTDREQEKGPAGTSV